jgi:hypothetical protein
MRIPTAARRVAALGILVVAGASLLLVAVTPVGAESTGMERLTLGDVRAVPAMPATDSVDPAPAPAPADPFVALAGGVVLTAALVTLRIARRRS